MSDLKILLLDIEISPSIVTVWGLFNQNIGLHSILGNSEILTWAAKWYGEKEVISASRSTSSKRSMLKKMHTLLSKADVVITYNGNGFDLKILNKEFLELGMSPPKPYKSLDLLSTMKNVFRGTSNKLDYWVKHLDLGKKIEHRGHQMWLDCMKGDKKAFAEMLEYNQHDVIILERLYKRVLPWIKNHPNRSVYTGRLVCPTCGSDHFQHRGYVRKLRTYKQFQCRAEGCGKWFRASVSEKGSKQYFTGVH